MKIIITMGGRFINDTQAYYINMNFEIDIDDDQFNELYENLGFGSINFNLYNDWEEVMCTFEHEYNLYPEIETKTLPFEENFDSGMPCDWTNDTKWTFGDVNDVLGPYWMIPDHNQFAVSNDDALMIVI